MSFKINSRIPSERHSMLISEKVKNLALIKEAETEFGRGLNIITGETGAGKSLVIGSVELALGGKAKGDIVRRGEDEASVELVFSVDSARERAEIEALDVEVDDDDLVIMTRKIRDGRSTARVNGNAVNASTLKKAASVLIDIHGQRDQAGLLVKKNLCRILDRYAGEAMKDPAVKVADHYKKYREIEREIEQDISDPEELKRRQDLLAFEVAEIEKAELAEGEDEEVEARYSLMKNSKKIAESLSEALGILSGNPEGNASEYIGRASESLSGLQGLDGAIDAMIGQISEIEALTGDLSIALGDRLRSMDFSDGDFSETEKRLDLINHMKSKYGKTIGEIYGALEEKKSELEKINDHDAYAAGLKSESEKEKKALIKACEKLSELRKEAALSLQEQMREALTDLNFDNVEFRIDVIPDPEKLSANGFDTVGFMISLNKGEKLMPLDEVASGGELSRIMLALKTVLADTDDIPTLIFDEIDTGISGRTAEKVAEKLSVLARSRQVIAITHLPQIAAMADHHFVIEKTSDESSTETGVREIKDEESVEELSRLLSGSEVTDAVRENAREMLLLAERFKNRT
ncbi:MAG: DNA repair protein RecN [Lachnospiraceae bacterium]|nr:DNA repair protein RecN [Lachnospiraceae bacterium]